MEDADLEEEKEARLRELIANRNYFGVEELLDNCGVKEETKAAFRVLEELTGGIEIMERAKKSFLVRKRCVQWNACQRRTRFWFHTELKNISPLISA